MKLQYLLPINKEKPFSILFPETLVYLGMASLGYAIPTSHSNTCESVGVIFILLGCFVSNRQKKEWGISHNPLNIPLILLFVTILISLTSCYHLSYTLNEIRGEFLTYTFLFYALAGFCKDRGNLYRVLSIFFLGNLLALFLFFYQFYTCNFNQGQFVASLGAKQLFSNGLTETSSYFLIFSSLYYAALFFVTRKKSLVWVTILLLFNLYMLYSSYQRAGVAGMAMVSFVPLLFLSKTYKNRIYFIIPVLLSLFFFIGLTPIKDKFNSKSWQPIIHWQFDKLDRKDAVQVRVLLYDHFWQSFKNHPFVGYGYGRSNLKKIDEESNKPRPDGYTHSHNTFFNFTLQTGVQGLAALLFLLFTQYRVFFKGLKRAREPLDCLVFAGALCLMAGFWTRMLFDDVYDSGTALAYWLVMGMAVGLYMKITEERNCCSLGAISLRD